jgi:hypothetical protein
MFKEAPSEKVAEWKERIEKQKKSGLSIGKWCKENGLEAHVFHYWKAKFLSKLPERNNFVELKEEKSKGIVLEYKEFQIHLDRKFDLEILRKCLSVLKGM